MKKQSLCWIVSAACFFAVALGVQAEPFTSSDMAGTWNGCAFQINPAVPAVYWLYGTMDIDNTGNITGGSMTAPTGDTASITSGTAAILPNGSISGSTTSGTGVTTMVADGILDQSRTLFSYVSAGSDNSMTLALGLKSGGDYIQTDMEGDWRVYGMEIDTGEGLVYWLMGDALIDSSGGMSGTYMGPVGGPMSTTGGQISVDSEGKLSGEFQFEGDVVVDVEDGMLDQGKSISTFVSSNNVGQLDFVVGFKKGATYDPSDLEGDWAIYDLVIDPQSGMIFWIYADGAIDSAGNMSGIGVGPDGSTLSITSGSLSLSTAGELSGSFTYETGDTDTIQSGFMDESKTVISYVGVSDSGMLDFGLGFKKKYDHNYYLPYFTADPGHWSGVGLTNLSDTQDAEIIVMANDNNGNTIATEDETLAKKGQTSFVVGKGLTGVGWMEVGATQPLAGLCFFGTLGSGNYMADITLIRSLSKTLYIPHVGQDWMWDTTVMICNPNPVATQVTIQHYNTDGTSAQSDQINIPANGSAQYLLKTLADVVQGHVRLTADYDIAAFALYTSLKVDGYCYSGISAIDPTDE